MYILVFFLEGYSNGNIFGINLNKRLWLLSESTLQIKQPYSIHYIIGVANGERAWFICREQRKMCSMVFLFYYYFIISEHKNCE